MRDVYADTPDAARYAGFWIRVFANVLDVLLVAGLVLGQSGAVLLVLLPTREQGVEQAEAPAMTRSASCMIWAGIR